MDIDDDQKPDLVWTRDPEGSGAFATGGAHWKVFKNTGNGFASQPVSWQVPAPAFDRTTYASGSKHWVTMDIDGDQKPDLVWTRNPEGSGAFDTGGSHWKVFKNTGRGFASQPVSWRVPAPAFDRMAYAYGSKHWVTMDIDGDQKPDLVWTRNPEGSGAFDTGGPHWKVFKNTGSGFASQPSSWWVPAPAFDRTVYASGAKQWVTMDLDGDGKPDLVWTRDPEGSGSFAAGGPHWKVFKNTGKGFTKQPTSWRIPGTSFSRTAYAYGSKRWSTFDLNGDKRPDLLWTRDPNASSCESFQQPAHWKLFLNQ